MGAEPLIASDGLLARKVVNGQDESFTFFGIIAG
jgi:hypothetical protein